MAEAADADDAHPVAWDGHPSQRTRSAKPPWRPALVEDAAGQGEDLDLDA